jgi:predicted N-acetyltransferase YhbS
VKLTQSVGWIPNVESMTDALERAVFCIVATDTRDGQAIGMARIVGDARGYFICDVIVVPAYQCQKIGSAIMETALAELRKVGPKGAFVGLFTGKPEFYARLGFRKDIGMHLAL